MVKNYFRRLIETRSRSLQSNQQLYQERTSQGKPSGVLERVILEQLRSSSSQNEGDSCAGSRLDYGSYD